MSLDMPAIGLKYPMPQTDEDLPRLARLAFDLAAVHCGECRNYHAMWGYLRSIGANGRGPEIAWTEKLDALVAAASGRSHVEWLLAGSADSGQLGLVHAAMARAPDATYRVTVVDRCETPLKVCEAFADDVGIELETIKEDLAAFHRDEAFDFVLMHHIIIFVPAEDQAGFLQHAASWLRPDGRLFMTSSYEGEEDVPRVRPKPLLAAWRAEVVEEAVRNGTIDLPEDAGTFIDRLSHMRDSRRPRQVSRRLDYWPAMVSGAGLTVEDVIEFPTDRVEKLLNPDTSPPSVRFLLVASPGSP